MFRNLFRTCGLLLAVTLAGCQPAEREASAPPTQPPSTAPRTLSIAPPAARDPAVEPESAPALETSSETPVREPSSAMLLERQPAVSPVVQKIYRPSDTRPLRDESRAAEFGVHKYVSKRLILYTDIEPELAEPLPEIIDQVYDVWVNYFGELPPNREGTPYQITGFLIDQPQRFVDCGMLPEGPPMFRFGRHMGAEFWMNKMNSDYYRRHLLIHEATHCFMTTMLQQYPPRWYLEGMAEYFGTHILHPNGQVTFAVMPERSQDFPGLGRVELIQQELAQQRFASLARLGAYTGRDWDEPLPVPYAWSWAVCEFLDQHPHYQKRFRELGQHMEGRDFLEYMQVHFEPEQALLEAEWQEFARRLVYQDDIPANAFVTHDGPLQEIQGVHSLQVEAAQGWQSTGLRVSAGMPVQITGAGEVILNQTTQPWRSQPQGISIEYAAGYPIGQLLAAVLSDENQSDSSLTFPVYPIGREQKLIAPADGELWLRINDHAHDLKNNTGQYQITVRKEDHTAD